MGIAEGVCADSGVESGQSPFVVQLGNFDIGKSFLQQARFESFLLFIFTVNDEEGLYF